MVVGISFQLNEKTPDYVKEELETLIQSSGGFKAKFAQFRQGVQNTQKKDEARRKKIKDNRGFTDVKIDKQTKSLAVVGMFYILCFVGWFAVKQI